LSVKIGLRITATKSHLLMGGMIHDFRVKDIFLKVSASPTTTHIQRVSTIEDLW